MLKCFDNPIMDLIPTVRLRSAKEETPASIIFASGA